MNNKLLITLALALTPPLALAVELIEFKSGTPAVAAEVNANFDALNDQVILNAEEIEAVRDELDALEATPGPTGPTGATGPQGPQGPQGEQGPAGGGSSGNPVQVAESENHVETVDCDADATLSDAIDASPLGFVTIEVSGACSESVTISRDNLTIEGVDGASIDGQVLITGRGITIENIDIDDGTAGIPVIVDRGSVTLDSVTITGDGSHGLIARDGAFADLVNTSVTINSNEDVTAVSVELNSGLRIRNGVSVSAQSTGTAVGVGFSVQSSVVYETETTGSTISASGSTASLGVYGLNGGSFIANSAAQLTITGNIQLTSQVSASLDTITHTGQVDTKDADILLGGAFTTTSLMKILGGSLVIVEDIPTLMTAYTVGTSTTIFAADVDMNIGIWGGFLFMQNSTLFRLTRGSGASNYLLQNSTVENGLDGGQAFPFGGK